MTSCLSPSEIALRGASVQSVSRKIISSLFTCHRTTNCCTCRESWLKGRFCHTFVSFSENYLQFTLRGTAVSTLLQTTREIGTWTDRLNTVLFFKKLVVGPGGRIRASREQMKPLAALDVVPSCSFVFSRGGSCTQSKCLPLALALTVEFAITSGTQRLQRSSLRSSTNVLT